MGGERSRVSRENIRRTCQKRPIGPSGVAMVTRPAKRRYEKGERRFKHESGTPEARIDFDKGNPKRAVGKCPNTIAPTTRAALLNDALPAPNGDRDVDFPKRLYAVHKGVIYQAITSDGGLTYHAYPYRGRVPKLLLSALRERAEDKGDIDQFDKWVREHISSQ